MGRPDNIESLYEKYLEASQKSSVLIHHDAITGTHSLSTKRDYEGMIEETKKILLETNEKVISVLDQYFSVSNSLDTP